MNPAVDTGLVQPAPRLVEIQWLWRRLWVFMTTLAALAILAIIIRALAAPGLSIAAAGALSGVAYGLLALIGAVGLVYLAGATAYELLQLAVAARIDVAAIKGADR